MGSVALKFVKSGTTRGTLLSGQYQMAIARDCKLIALTMILDILLIIAAGLHQSRTVEIEEIAGFLL